MLAMSPMIHLVDQMTPTSPGTCHHQCSDYILNWYVCYSIIMLICMHVLMYVFMLNKNSLRLLKKGAAKQSRVESIAKL